MKKQIILVLVLSIFASNFVGCTNIIDKFTKKDKSADIEQVKEQVRQELEEEQAKKDEEEKVKEEEQEQAKKAAEEEAKKKEDEKNELKESIKKEIQNENSNNSTSVVIVKETIPQSVYYSNSYIFPQSSNCYLSSSQVKSCSNYELGIARNEIYARHGYIFQLTQFKRYFESQNWYVPRTSNQSNISLNSYERYNVDLIKAEENRRGVTW